jgi:hypothetical protein
MTCTAPFLTTNFVRCYIRMSNVLPCTATYCHVLLHTVMYCYILQCTATYCHVLLHTAMYCYILQCTATYCHVLLYTAIYCYILPCTFTWSRKLHYCTCCHPTLSDPHLKILIFSKQHNCDNLTFCNVTFF